ncbi:hypothetical protein [uncultured Nostoc sp.]|uniref:hypothetical protein n=1 Tax=uncultured Nostoc sp. TaxID=340711 RepID=UPI0035C9A9C0
MNNTLASTLGELQTKIYWLHDAEKFAELAQAATEIYIKLGYDQQKSENVGHLISEAYQLSDDADLSYKAGKIENEIKFYNQVKDKFLEVEAILGLPKSIAEHQIKWWIYFRHKQQFKVIYHLFLQHFKSLGFSYLFIAIQLTYYMLKIGKGHNLRNIEITQKNATKYWLQLLKFNINKYPYLG